MWKTIFPHLEFCRPKPNQIYFLCDIYKVVDLDIFICKIYSYWTSLVSFLESELMTSKLVTPTTNIQWSTSTNLVRSAPVVIMADQNPVTTVCQQNRRQTSGFLDWRPWPVVPAPWVRVLKRPGHAIMDKIQICGSEAVASHHGFFP